MDRSYKIALLVVLLLAVVGVFNELTGTGDDTTDPVVKEEKEPPTFVELPEPLGPEDAAVIVKSYVTSTNDCTLKTINQLLGLSKDFGDDVRIEFGDLAKPEVLKEARDVKVGCQSGITINGKTRYIVPEAGLSGGVIDMNGLMGEKYTIKDIKKIIAYLINTGNTTGADEKKTGEEKAVS